MVVSAFRIPPLANAVYWAAWLVCAATVTYCWWPFDPYVLRQLTIIPLSAAILGASAVLMVASAIGFRDRSVWVLSLAIIVGFAFMYWVNDSMPSYYDAADATGVPIFGEGFGKFWSNVDLTLYFSLLVLPLVFLLRLIFGAVYKMVTYDRYLPPME